MTSEDSPAISLTLKGYPNLSLNFGRDSLSDAAHILIKSHSSEPLVLHLNGLRGNDYNLDVIPALQSGLFELVDAQTKEVKPVPRNDAPVRPKTIVPCAIEEVQTILFEPQSDFWRGLVWPTRNYFIRFSNSGGTSYCIDENSEDRTEHTSQDSADRHLTVCRGQSTIAFTVRDDPKPLKFSLDLSATSSICHLSAEAPAFEFIVSITSHETQPIIVDLRHTPFAMYDGLSDIVKIEDKQFGEEVEMPYGQGCFLDNDGPEDFPQKAVPQLFSPGQAWVQRYALKHFDKETSNGGELECLEEGTEYEVNLSQAIQMGFSSWTYGGEEKLPVTEKDQRQLEGNGTIVFDISGSPFAFRVEN